MTALSPTAPAGAPVQYQLKITNNSSTTVSSAVVADTFPPTLSAGGSSPIVNPAGATRLNNVVSGVSTVTITTTVPHLLVPGQSVTISSVPAPTTPNPIQAGFFLTDPSFTGVYQVLTTPTANTFTYQQSLTTSSFPQPTLTIAATNGAQRLSGTVTITTTQQFQFPAGETVTIANVGNPSFNVPSPGVPSPKLRRQNLPIRRLGQTQSAAVELSPLPTMFPLLTQPAAEPPTPQLAL